jgi:hypothetical protein
MSVCADATESEIDEAAHLLGRLPYEPLERLARVAYGAPSYDNVDARTDDDDGADHGLWCDAAAALVLGTTHRQIARWRNDGMTAPAADKHALHLGYNPVEVWGWFEWHHASVMWDASKHLQALRAAATRAARAVA